MMTAVAGTLCCLLKGRPRGLAGVIAICILTACGKEMYDLVVNPWGLSAAQLMDDILKDLFFDILGTVLGIVLWWR